MKGILKQVVDFKKAIKSTRKAMSATPAQLHRLADAAKKMRTGRDNMLAAFKFAMASRRFRFDGVLCSRCGEKLKVRLQGSTVEFPGADAWLECEPCGRVLP